jgi:hypothetical protein
MNSPIEKKVHIYYINFEKFYDFRKFLTKTAIRQLLSNSNDYATIDQCLSICPTFQSKN